MLTKTILLSIIACYLSLAFNRKVPFNRRSSSLQLLIVHLFKYNEISEDIDELNFNTERVS